jgi:SRR1
MPHTSRNNRKKPLHSKRVEVTDDDGWTHVANTHTSSRANSRKTISMVTDGAADDPDEPLPLGDAGEQKLPLLLPAEAPSRLSITDLRKQFEAHLATWESSLAWQHLKSSLLNDVLANRDVVDDGAENSQIDIDNVVCISLGSPSGFVQGGWVDRRSVALYQLAALVSIVNCLKKVLLEHTSPHGRRQVKEEETANNKPLRVIAQDPVFNTHDTQLLSSLGITVVQTPEGFNSITSRTFLFAPGAERRHLQLILPSNPVMIFGGPLEEEPSLTVHANNGHNQSYISNNSSSSSSNVLPATDNAISRFTTQTRSVKIADFEPKSETFWRMRIYWRDR